MGKSVYLIKSMKNDIDSRFFRHITENAWKS